MADDEPRFRTGLGTRMVTNPMSTEAQPEFR
jgi:hypothetical protein